MLIFHRFALLLILLFCGISLQTYAQFPTLPLLPAPVETASAPVQLQDRILFRVYGENLQSANDRADLIQFRLDETLRDLPNRPVPEVRVITEGGSPVVTLNGEPLMTVTKADVAGYGQEPFPIAQRWARQMETALKRSLEERRPGFLRQAAIHAGGILFLGLVAHLFLWVLFRRLLDRPGWPLIAFLWLAVLLYLLDLFPQTRPAYNLLTAGVLRPFMIAGMVILGAVAVARLWSVLLNHLFPPLPATLSAEERTERTLLRRMTLIYVTRVTGITVIWILSIIAGLTWSGVNLPALLASAGLIGVALGLAAQDTMRDMVSGVNVLLDDRYGVGDVIKVGEFTGRVERFNLRVTQIRDLSGRLITFPNRTIETVANLTASWSQVDLKMKVTYRTDLRRAMDVIEETAHQLAVDWPERILAPPEMLGVNDYTGSTIEIRMIVRTTPGDQWAVERELHLRIKEAMERAHIPPPFPHQVVSVIRNGEGKGESVDREEG